MFEQIVLIDDTGLQPDALAELQSLSRKPLQMYADVPQSSAEKLARIAQADAVFVSWNTRLEREILEQCPHLKYVGMCCSLIDESSANVDVAYCRQHNIGVMGIRDYGDEGVAEFVVSELIQLFKGLGRQQWKAFPVELTGRRIGLLGMGVTAQMLAHRLQAFGAEVLYYSRTRKPEVETPSCRYLPLNELLQQAEVLSFHLPRHAVVMGAPEFELFGKGKVLVNTSLGLCFEKEAFVQWLQQEDNYAIFDGVAFGPDQDLKDLERLLYTEKVSGWTQEAKLRLSRKVLDNVKDFLATNTN